VPDEIPAIRHKNLTLYTLGKAFFNSISRTAKNALRDAFHNGMAFNDFVIKDYTMNPTSFEGFGLPETLSAALARMNYSTPTPIQAQSIPPALEGRDIMGSAQTGTGKTAAFCIPMIAYLINNPQASAMVMTPTRELAMQVLDVARQMVSRDNNIRSALLIGGEPMGKQFKQLNDRPRLIVGTPGRMNDHLRRNPELFEDTSFVVLDEADRMLDMGFSVQIDTILEASMAVRQTLMFSATFPDKIVKFARTYLENPQRVEIESQKVSAENISHQMIQTSQDGKYNVLLGELETRMGSIIVFVKTKHGADKLAGKLQDNGHDSQPLHGGLNQRQRERATRGFRKMEYRILVATDVAARGLDIPHVEHVINYDMPMVAEDYVHRIGRTARAGAKGNALAIVSPSDRGLWSDVERVLNPGAPRAARSNDERSEGRKPFRKGGFSKGGFNKGGFKKREDGEQRSSFGGDRPSYNNDRPRAPRPEGQGNGGKQKKEDGERNYANRTSFNDRPRTPRPEGGNFRKREDGEQRQSYGERKPFDGERKPFNGDRKPFNGDRPAYNNDRPRAPRPEGQGNFRKREDGEQRQSYGDRKPFDGERKPFNADRKPYSGDRPAFNNDRPRGAKPEGKKFGENGGKKFAGKKPEGRFERSDKPRGDKPQARRGSSPYSHAPKAGGKPGFKKPYAA
jgi:superfamily II DNA/RNA helicase